MILHLPETYGHVHLCKPTRNSSPQHAALLYQLCWFQQIQHFPGKGGECSNTFLLYWLKMKQETSYSTRNRQIHPFSSLAKNRHLPLTIDHPPVNGPVKSCSSDTAKVLGQSGPGQNSALQTDNTFGVVFIGSKNIHAFIAWADCRKGVGRNTGKKQ